MNLLEKDIEDDIYFGLKSESNLQDLNRRGLITLFSSNPNQPTLPSITYRQKRLKAGIADIVSVYRNDKDIVVNIYEIKRQYINVKSICQVLRYWHCIKEWFEIRGFEDRNYKINCILVGKELASGGDVKYLYEFLFDIGDFERVQFYEYDIITVPSGFVIGYNEIESLNYE